MPLSRWMLVSCLVGCSFVERGGAPSLPDEPEARSTQRGWFPAEGSALHVERSGDQHHNPDVTVVSPDGAHLLFRIEGNICRTHVASGRMDRDQEWPEAGEVVDTAGNDGLTASGAGVLQFLGDDQVDVLTEEPSLDAASADGGVAYLTEDCTLHWQDGVPADLGRGCLTADDPLVSAGQGVLGIGNQLLYATPEHSWVVEPGPVDHVAYDQATTMVASIQGTVLSGRSLEGFHAGQALGRTFASDDVDSWSLDLDNGGDAYVLSLHSNAATGVFAVEMLRDDNRVLEMFDTADGTFLGRLDIGDGTRSVSFADHAGVMASANQNRTVLWTLLRPE